MPRVFVFVFGLGYSALAVARLLKGRVEIAGTTRDPARADALRAEGIAATVFDGASPTDAASDALRRATHILVSVPPVGEMDTVLAAHGDDLGKSPHLQWIGYLSSVAVYGNYGGAWVSERTTPHPKTERAVRRRKVELEWQRFGVQHEVPVAIFRIAGIYGPGRNAFVALSEGRAHRVVKLGQVFNRIHVDDIAAAVAAGLLSDMSGVVNLADDGPSPPQEVVTFAAELMGVAPPPEIAFDEAKLSPMAQSFYVDNKRVDNARMKVLTGGGLKFPTYREGLAAMWTSGFWKG
jgi:nucleoside-diphosphate-sugar epimerase